VGSCSALFLMLSAHACVPLYNNCRSASVHKLFLGILLSLKIVLLSLIFSESVCKRNEIWRIQTEEVYKLFAHVTEPVLTSCNSVYNKCSSWLSLGERGSVVGWGAMLQAGRSRVRFPMRSLDFRDSVFDITTGNGLDDRGVGVRAPIGSRIFSSSRRPDRLWGPPNVLANGNGGLFPWG
jgi:hypothetical protein